MPDSQGLVLQLFSAHRICWCISFYPVVNLWEHSDGATHLTKWSKWILRDSTVRAFTTMSKSSTFAVWMLCYTGTTWHMYLFPADPPGKKPDPRTWIGDFNLTLWENALGEQPWRVTAQTMPRKDHKIIGSRVMRPNFNRSNEIICLSPRWVSTELPSLDFAHHVGAGGHADSLLDFLSRFRVDVNICFAVRRSFLWESTLQTDRRVESDEIVTGYWNESQWLLHSYGCTVFEKVKGLTTVLLCSR